MIDGPLAALFTDHENGTPAWRKRATCHRLVNDPDQPVRLTQKEVYRLFYPTRHSNSAASAAAKEICDRWCAVREECANHALETNDKFGIRGGLTADDRRTIRSERGMVGASDDLDDYLDFDEE